jgi:hypothetical protein
VAAQNTGLKMAILFTLLMTDDYDETANDTSGGGMATATANGNATANGTRRHCTPAQKIRSSSEILFATNLKMPEHRLNMQPTRVSALISIWRTPLSHRAPLRENLISKIIYFRNAGGRG